MNETPSRSMILLATALRGGARRVACLAFLLLAPALFALNPDRRADGYLLQGWFTEHGLPSNAVRDLVQSRDGYLWLATSQGIVRFDGQRFTVFNGTHPGLDTNDFYAVIEAPDGSLWFGSDNGLFHRKSDGHFEHFTTQHGLPHNYVRNLALARDGAVVACTRLGYSFVRDGRLVTPDGIWKKIRGGARSFLERADGSILLGTTQGLWRIVGAEIEQLSDRDSLKGSSGFFALIETSDNIVWIGYNGGLHCIHPDGSRQDFGEEQGLTDTRVAALRQDRDGNLWIAGYGTLHRYSRGRFESTGYDERFGGTPLQQIIEDREGGLWIGTVTGLFRLKDTIGRGIGVADGLKQTSTYAVLESGDGAWWMSLWYGGVYRYDGKRATRVPALAPLEHDRVFSLANDPDGSLWIGAESGLYRYDGQSLQNFYQADQHKQWEKQIAEQPGVVLPGLAHNWVTAIASDGEGGMWASAHGAIYHGKPGHFRAYTEADGLPGGEFKSMFRARNGDIWSTVPTVGVIRFHEGRWQSYLCGREIPGAGPSAIFEDETGAIWVTTLGGGIYRFKADRWRTFTTRDGLAHDHICGIVQDTFGDLWIAYPRGIMRIARTQFDELDSGQRNALQPHIFNHADGLPRGEINSVGRPSATRTRDGRLLFATDLGVAIIEPWTVRINALKPPVYIERLDVDGKTVNLSHAVAVPPGGRDIRINYTAISLLAPEKVRFKTRLTPLDEDWVDVGAQRAIHYAQLPPGNYTFHVTASNNDGVWSDTIATTAFVVRPRFYQTWWFITLSIAVVFAAIAGLVWQRSRRAARAMATLTRLVDERTHELKAAKDHAEAAVVAKNESIGALRRAQAEITAERARFKFIFEAVPVGIALVQRSHGSLYLVNPAHERITGIPRQLVDRPHVFEQVTHPDDLELQRQLVAKFRAGEIDHFTLEKRYVHSDGRVVWVTLSRRMYLDPFSGGQQWVTTLVDITERKEAEARLAETHRELLATSRQAGMAEVATGVLHNVGNVLNSVNVSATLVIDLLRASKTGSVRKLDKLVSENAADLARFFTEDPRGRIIPGYLGALATELETEQTTMSTELEHLRKNIEHIRDIVAMQQSYARVSGVLETVPVVDLVEDALRINAAGLTRHGLEVVRNYVDRPVATTERHKVIQILVNLIRNAKYACDDVDRPDKKLTLRVTAAEGRVKISVIDNGVGIPAENLTRIFGHGFTTRRDGHGFGLHSGALVARELGGSLSVHSDGPRQGARFTLELPLQPASISL